MAFASPGVQIKEVDLTATVNVSDQNIGVVAIASAKGPTDEVTYVSSERELVDIFGEPSEYNYESWFAAATVIQYGGVAAVIRPAGGEPGAANDLSLRTANVEIDGTTSTSLLINNQADYEENYGGVTSAFAFAGRYGGTFHNGITVAMVDVGAHQRVTVSRPAAGAISGFDTPTNVGQTGRTAGTYNAVAGTGGSGTGITFDVVVAANGDATVTLAGPGNGAYNNAEVITIPAVGNWGVGDITVAIAGNAAGFNNATGLTFANPRTANTFAITATGGSGSGAVFSVVVAANGSATITLTTAGTGYADNEVLTLPRAGAYGGATDITVAVNGVGGTVAFQAAGQYIKWASGSNTYEGTIYSNDATDSYEVTLWESTKRLVVGSVIQDNTNATIATVTAIESNDLYSTKEYATGKKWVSIAPQPGTSPFVKARGGKFDEFHIVLVDSDGNVTGNPGTLIESFTYASKASDAKSTEGDSKFWKKVIELSSSFIYGGDRTLTQASDLIQPENSAGVNSAGAVGNTSASTVFPVFNKVVSRKLASGADFDFVGAAASIQGQVEAAYDLVLDPEEFADIDFLIPGKVTPSGAAKLISVAESRRDCIAVVSPQRSDVINSNTSTKKTDSVIDFFNTLQSTSYAIFDSGYKYVYDKYNDTYRYLPCAADVAGLCISTTINSETWFSPAGYNRGNLRNATKLAYSPKQSERDRLYTARINPVVSFPGQGIVLFGDKTALSSPSAFDRINVRRLFIELEKNIARFSKFQLFEINDEITRAGFKGACDPYLRNVQGRRGIYDFLVVCDDSNNTPDVVDRNEFQAEIYIKPARTINFITITFVATRTGVSFNELIG